MCGVVPEKSMWLEDMVSLALSEEMCRLIDPPLVSLVLVLWFWLPLLLLLLALDDGDDDDEVGRLINVF